MRSSVPGVTLPPGTTLAWYDSLDSTNEEARRRAREGEHGPLWIVTEHQTSGRGRQGRSWSSPEGNLAATYLFKPWLRPSKMALLSFAAALAVRDLVHRYGPPVELKWPNDVLVRRQKIAGILLESSSPGGTRLAIGIGVNLVAHPDDTPFPATSLRAESGKAPSLPEALTILAAALEGWLTVFRYEGFAMIRDAWLAAAAGLGGPLSVRLANETLTGTFRGLHDDGALRLALADGSERLISAGDVFFPGPG